MIKLPHNFSRFITANRPATLLIGAGVSYDLVPLPFQLIKDKKETVEKNLIEKYACTSVDIDLEKNDALYEWAEKLITQLRVIEPDKAKLILAQELGLTTDPLIN